MENHHHSFPENRSFTRYPANDSSAVLLTPGDIISYDVMDISKSGMAFCYTGNAINRVMNRTAVTLFGDSGSFSIAVQVISDTELKEAGGWAEEEPYLRRCGVKFIFLTHEDEMTVQEYIQGLKKDSVYLHKSAGLPPCH